MQHQNSNIMEEKERHTERLSDMSVVMQTIEEKPELSFVRGKACLDKADKRMTFVENAPRGARSVEVARQPHSRVVRRPDGLYTLTLRFGAGERYLKSVLQSEVRNIVDAVALDYEKQNRKEKEK